MLPLYIALVDADEEKSKLEVIYYEYRDRMMGVAISVLHNQDDAEDAVHNAFLSIAKNIKTIDEPMSEKTRFYVLKAAKNAAIDIYNKKNRIIMVDDLDDSYISDESFFTQMYIKERYNEVVNAIIELKDTYKIPMYYYFVNEMKEKDIAVLLGIKASAVRMRILRGKKELLNVLGEYNG